jgi:hypothetical protein
LLTVIGNTPHRKINSNAVIVSDVTPSITEYYLRLILTPEIDKRQRTTEKYRNGQIVGATVFKYPLTFEETLDRRIAIQLIDCGKIGW